MSIQSQIDRIKTNIANAYSVVTSMNGTTPATANSVSLASAIKTISAVTEYGTDWMTFTRSWSTSDHYGSLCFSTYFNTTKNFWYMHGYAWLYILADTYSSRILIDVPIPDSVKLATFSYKTGTLEPTTESGLTTTAAVRLMPSYTTVNASNRKLRFYLNYNQTALPKGPYKGAMNLGNA